METLRPQIGQLIRKMRAAATRQITIHAISIVNQTGVKKPVAAAF
ncbi:MAG: hypothetical protein WBG27_11935 [Candidatus Aquilonibacter sp.]